MATRLPSRMCLITVCFAMLALATLSFGAEQTETAGNLDNQPPAASTKAESQDAQIQIYLSALALRAVAGDPKAETELAVVYLKGSGGTRRDLKQACYLIFDAAGRGNPEAEYYVYLIYSGDADSRDKGLAVYWLQRAAEAGSPPAAEALGEAYEHGSLELPVDAQKARDLYRKAALANHPPSMLSLARCYDAGTGGAIDKDKALIWALKAAGYGNIDGGLLAARFYWKGEGSQKPNVDLAWLWTSLAKLDGLHTDAQKTTYADLRESLAKLIPPEKQAANDRLAARFNRLAYAGVSLKRPDLTDHTELAIEHPNDDHKFELNWSSIVLPVFINGRGPFHFLLDTGSSACMIDSAVSRKLHLHSLGICPSFKDPDGAESLVEADCSIFKNKLHHGVFIEDSFSDISRAACREIDGLLGHDFISPCVVEIDYESQTIRFVDSDAYHHDPAMGAEIPLEFSNGVPRVGISVGGLHCAPISVQAFVDTGNAGPLNLNQAFNRENPVAALVTKSVPVKSATAHGVIPGIQGRLPFIEIGPYRIPDPRVQCDDLVQTSEPMASLGGDELRRFKVTFDYKHKRMFLEPNARLNQRIKGAWTGYSAIPTKPGSQIQRIEVVYPDSPASKAELRVGDILTELDGKSGRALLATMAEPADFIDPASPSSAKDEVGKVKREGKIIPFKLTPEEY